MATLIAAFSSYFNKWHALLRGTWVNVLDEEIASFVSMFTLSSVSDLASVLRRATEGMTSEDIMHELIVSFIDLAHRYKDMGSGFTAYLVSSMKYRVYKWVSTAREMPLVRYEDSVDGAVCEAEGVPDTILLTDPDLLPGITSQMRTILYMRYVTGMTASDIAEYLHVSASTVRSRIAAARKILRQVDPREDTLLDEESHSPSG